MSITPVREAIITSDFGECSFCHTSASFRAGNDSNLLYSVLLF
ncbi:Transcriptional regulator, GntR family protein [Shigella dysenteriae 1617]|uniref:Transcriptional regulator, GntR family protein n=1 Tax=Shigella dysenteriae 1617 TaxID=754093 RepID=A0A0A6ZT63_SHIDY|nr:Transcriptional regulator, GntR family protein [Shigella dysenteriae 1617]